MAEEFNIDTALQDVLQTPVESKTPVVTKEPFAVEFVSKDTTPYHVSEWNAGLNKPTVNNFTSYFSQDPSKRNLDKFIYDTNKNAIENGGIDITTIEGGQLKITKDEELAWNILGNDPNEVARIKAKGPIGFVEGFKMLNKWEVLPYLNTVASAEDVKAYNILNSLKKGKQVSEEDKKYAQEYLREMTEIQLRGFSFGGHMAYSGLRMPAYGIEFAAALASGGSAAGATIARESGEAATKIAIKKTIQEGVKKMAIGGLKMTASPKMWHRTIRGYYDNKITDSINITDKGQAIFNNADEKPALMLLKSFGNNWIENSSELAGSFLFKPVAGAIGRKLPKGFGTGWTNLVEKTVGLKYADAVKKYGYDGLLEEIGEERVGDFLRVATGLDKEEGYSFDQFGKALFPDFDQLLVEAGLIGIYGGSSLASAKLIEKISGGDTKEIESIIKDVNSMSENQKEAMLKKIETIETEKDIANFESTMSAFKKQLETVGMTPEEIDANTQIWSNVLANMATKRGVTRTSIAEEILPVVTRENVPQGVSQQENVPLQTISQKQNDVVSLPYEDLFKMSERTSEEKSQVLQELSRRIYEGVEKNSSINLSTEEKSELQGLRNNLLSKGKDTKETLRSVLESELGKTSPRLQQAIRDSLAVQTMPSGTTQTPEVKILHQNKRGMYFTEGGINIVKLLKDADRSTFIHESAHIFLNYYLKNIPEELDSVFKFAGVQNKPLNELSAREYRKLQESFATGFEAYLMNGKAPNENLANAFDRFKNWLTEVYQTVENLVATSGLKIELSNDIKKFYDELLSIPIDREVTIDKSITKENLIDSIKLYQSLQEKIEKVKENVKKLRKTIRGRVKLEINEIQNELIKTINELNLPSEAKGKMLTNIRNANTTKSLIRETANIETKAKNFFESEYMNVVNDKIIDLLKLTKSKSERGILKGKYEYEFNKLFEELRNISKLTKSEAKTRLQYEFDKSEPETGEGITSENKLIRMALSWKATGLSEGTTQLFTEFYSSLTNAISIAKESQSEKEFEEKINLKNDKDEVINLINSLNLKGNREDIPVKAMNFYRLGFADLYSLLNSIGGKKLADKYAMDIKEKDKASELFKKRREVFEEAINIFNVKTEYDVQKKLDEMNQENYKLYEIGRDMPKNISKLQIIDIYNSIKNENSRNNYYKIYGQEQIDGLISNLLPSEIEFADYLQEQVQGFYDMVNEIHIKQFGLDLGKIDNYWPRSSEQAQKEPYDEYRQATQISSAQKQRASNVVPIPQNAFLVFNKHMDNAIHQNNLFDIWYKSRKVFDSRNVKNAIEDRFGKEINSKIKEMIDKVSFNANNKQLDHVGKIIMKTLANWTGAKILLNASIAPKQFIAAFNYMEDMPAIEFGKYFLEGLSNPKETVKYMFENSKYLPARFSQGADEVMNNIMSQGESTAKKQKITDYLSFFIRVGDAGAVTMGGYPYVKYLQDMGMNKEEAFKKFEELTIRTQQAGFKTSLSGFQDNPAWKFFTAFKNAQNQYMRRVVNAIIQYKNGDIDKKQLSKTLFIYLIAQPALFGVVTQAFKSLIYGDDDDFTDDIIENIISNPFQVIPIGSEIMNMWIQMTSAKIQDEKLPPWSREISTPLISDLEKFGRHTFNIMADIGSGDDVDFTDILKSIEIGTEVGAGLPIGNIRRQITGVSKRFE